MNPEYPKKLFEVRYTLSKAQIADFVNGLYEIQADMIEAAVATEERKGFPKVK